MMVIPPRRKTNQTLSLASIAIAPLLLHTPYVRGAARSLSSFNKRIEETNLIARIANMKIEGKK